ncbi:hypothetical protein H1R20_g15647, partial [Candolleomyces eurysporus]
MGRKIKYRTEEERRQARRERRAVQAKDPKRRQKRSEENRRQYLRRRGIPGTEILPPNLSKQIIEQAAQDLDRTSRYFVRFLTDSEDAIYLAHFEVTQDDLKAFDSPPPYPPVVDQLAEIEEWGHVILALRGYQHRLQNVEDTQNFQLSTRDSGSAIQLADKLHEQYIKTLGEWEKIMSFIEENDEPDSVSARIAQEAILGKARKMVHVRNDLLLIKQGVPQYIQALDNRTYTFAKLSRPMYY